MLKVVKEEDEHKSATKRRAHLTESSATSEDNGPSPKRNRHGNEEIAGLTAGAASYTESARNIDSHNDPAAERERIRRDVNSEAQVARLKTVSMRRAEQNVKVEAPIETVEPDTDWLNFEHEDISLQNKCLTDQIRELKERLSMLEEEQLQRQNKIQLVHPTGAHVDALPRNINVPQALAQPATPNFTRRQHLESLDKDTLIQIIQGADDTHRNLIEEIEGLRYSFDERLHTLHAQFFLGDETFSPASLNRDNPFDIYVNSERDIVRTVFHYNLPSFSHLGEVPNQFFHGVVRARGKHTGKSLGLKRCSLGVDAFAAVPKKFTLEAGTPISVSIGAPNGGRKLVLHDDVTDFLLSGETDLDTMILGREFERAFVVAAQVIDQNSVQQGGPVRPPVGRVTRRRPDAQRVPERARVQQYQRPTARTLHDFDVYVAKGHLSVDKRDIFTQFEQAWNLTPSRCLAKPLLAEALANPIRENLYAIIRSAPFANPEDLTKAAIMNRFKRKLLGTRMTDEDLYAHPFVKKLETRIVRSLEDRTDITKARARVVSVSQNHNAGATPQP